MPRHVPGLPSRDQILRFIETSDTPAGKREIARAFALHGADKIALKALLKDMADEGLIDAGPGRAFHKQGGVPKVTVLRIVDIEGDQIYAVPESWVAEGVPPPRLRVVERGRRQAALGVGDRILARTEEAGRGLVAHPLKKLARGEELVLGVVHKEGDRLWLKPVDKRERHSLIISDVGDADVGDLVLAEKAGRPPRITARVTERLGDPFAPRSFSLIAIHKYGIPDQFTDAALDEAKASAARALGQGREDLRHLPIVAIDPADARDHDDAIWAVPDEDPANPGGWQAIVAIADVAYYVRPGTALDREARKRGNSVYFPDRVVPMLPEILSADVCSLGDDADRAALACHMTLNAGGEIVGFRFTRALVRIAAVIAYEDAQAAVDSHEQARSLGTNGNVGDTLAADGKEAHATPPPFVPSAVEGPAASASPVTRTSTALGPNGEGDGDAPTPPPLVPSAVEGPAASASPVAGASTTLGTKGEGDGDAPTPEPLVPSAVEGQAASASPVTRTSTTLSTNGEGEGDAPTPPPFVPSAVEGPAASASPVAGASTALGTNGILMAALHNLWACWAALNIARGKREPLDLDLPERRVVLDEQGRIASVAARERLDAHKVVEEFMIAANVAAAKALEKKQAPVMYRIHETPSREKLSALKDYLATFDVPLALGQVVRPKLFNKILAQIGERAEKQEITEQVLRTQMQAVYAPANIGHFGLALASYAHFTSPIRRYADLLVHRALVGAYKLDPEDAATRLAADDGARFPDIGEAISKAERRAMEAERETIDRYVAAYLSTRVGELLDTRITGVQRFGFFATVEGLGGDGLVPVSTLGAERFDYDEAARTLNGTESGDVYHVGQRLKLRLVEANVASGALRFELAEGANHMPMRGGKDRRRPVAGRRGRPGNIRHQGRR